MRKYEIWNKKDDVLTPAGKLYTAEQWMEEFPVAKIDNVAIVCSAGIIKGAFFGILEQMIRQYEKQGVDFSACTTDEEKLQAIEDFDEEQEKAQAQAEAEATANAVYNEELTATSLASIAASMEYQNMLTLDDVEEV